MGTSWCARVRVWERGCGQTIYCSVQERECGRPPSLGTRKSCRTAKAWGLEAGSMSDYGQIINSRLHLGTIRSKTCSFEFPKNNRNGEAFILRVLSVFPQRFSHISSVFSPSVTLLFSLESETFPQRLCVAFWEIPQRSTRTLGHTGLVAVRRSARKSFRYMWRDVVFFTICQSK